MKLFFSIVGLSTLLFSQEIFLDQSWLSSRASYTQSKTFCHPLKKVGGSFCEKASLSYPLFYEAPDSHIAAAIEKVVQTAIHSYEKTDLKHEVINHINEGIYQPQVTWYNSIVLDLFAVTEHTFTLKEAGNGYTGGAHGYYNVNYANYTHEGKKITLDSLFGRDHNATLQKVAKNAYKKGVGLKPGQSLVDDGWSSDKFVLTPNFAITAQGLLFHYNSYEIKSYADGHTEFMLPYRDIRSIIDPSGPLSNFLQIPKRLNIHYAEEDIAAIQIQTERLSEDQVKVTVTEKQNIFADRGWLSLSFPQFKNKKSIKVVHKSGFKTVKVYPSRSKLYHNIRKKAIRSTYTLVEGEIIPNQNKHKKELTLILSLPPTAESLIMRVRTSFKKGKELKTMPSDYEGVPGQQGFKNYQVEIPLH